MWSALTVMAPPEEPAVTLDQAKQFLRIDGDDEDAQLIAFIVLAIEQIEAITGVRLAPQTVELRSDDWSDLARLPIGPATEVVSIHYLDPAGTEQLFDAGNYRLAGAGLAGNIFLDSGNVLPAILLGPAGTIRVTVKVGYEKAPAPLWAAALYIVGDLYAFRETVAIGAAAQKIPMSATVETLITNYRIWL